MTALAPRPGQALPVGAPVRVRKHPPETHCRTPFYMRGIKGEITDVMGVYRDPSLLAFHKPGLPMRVLYRVTQFKWVPKAGAHAEARRLLSPAIRFSIEDCVDLPPCTTQMRDVEFSPEQAKAYKEMARALRITIGSRTITAVKRLP